MSGEYVPTARLFDLDALDQDSGDAAVLALDAEYQRVLALPDHARAMARYQDLILELNPENLPLERKTANFLTDQAIEIAAMLHQDPSRVANKPREFAARFFGSTDASREAVLSAYERFLDYTQTLSWAVTFGLSVAQARRAIAEVRPKPIPDTPVHEGKVGQ